MRDDGQRWKSAMLTMEDSAFFDIMRNYFGELRTPFNKHSLLAQLSAFLQQEDVQERIRTLIDTDDARLLTAISLLKEPDEDRLQNFLGGNPSYLEVHHHLLNLEERLLVYREKEAGLNRIRLNPFLAQMIRAEVVDPGLLFPSGAVPTPEAPLPWLSDSLLLAFLAFLLQNQEILKADGELRKKAEQEIDRIFPVLSGKGAGGRRLFLLLGLLENAGLIRRRGIMFTPVWEAWEHIALLPLTSRMPLLWAAAGYPGGPTIRKRAEALVRLLSSLEPGRGFTEQGLAGLLALSGEESGCTWPSGTRAFVRLLQDLEVIVPAGEDSGENTLYTRNPHVLALLNVSSGSDGQPSGDATERQHHEAAAVIQPNFEVNLTPWVPLKEGLVIPLTADILQFDT